MKNIFIREGADSPWEIIITDEHGQDGEPLKLTDKQLLDFSVNLSNHTRTAWQRIKNGA